MSVSLSPNLPANVVEIGNEISQAKIDEINAGTLALQTWVSASYLTTASASSTYAPKASPTFTGTVTIPAGASISGYLTTSSAASTYQTQAGMSSYLTTASAASTYQTISGMSSYLTTASAASTYQTAAGMSSYATQSYVTSQGYLTDAPSNGSEYVRKNGAWAVATGGGGGGISDAPNDGSSYVRNSNNWTLLSNEAYPLTGNPSGFLTSASLSVTNIALTGDFTGYSMGSGFYSFKYDSAANTLRMQDGFGSGITVSATGITFPDSTVQTTAPLNYKQLYDTGGVNYTLQASDINKIVYATFGSNVTIPLDSTYNFPIGTVILICNETSYSSNILPEDTFMQNPVINAGMASLAVGDGKTIVKVAANKWKAF